MNLGECVDLGGIFDYSGYFLRGRIGLGLWAFVSVEKIWVFRLTYCRVE